MDTASVQAPAALESVELAWDSVDDRRQLEARLYGDGLSSRRIGVLLGVTPTTVRRDLEALGVPRRSLGEAARRRRKHEPNVIARAVGLGRAGRTQREIASELGVSPATVFRWLRDADVPRRRPGVNPTRLRQFKELRERIMSTAGGCGSPTCDDPSCSLPYGSCHRPGCDQPAVIASQTYVSRRWVAGMPTTFCSGICSALVHAPHSDFAQRLEGERTRGNVDLRDAARLIDRTANTLLRHVHALEVGRRVGWSIVLTPEELDAVRRRVENAPTGGDTHRDPVKRESWYRRRFDSPKMAGRLAKQLAEIKGKRVGRPGLTHDQRKLIAELYYKTSLTQEKIAKKVGCSRTQVKRQVAKILVETHP